MRSVTPRPRPLPPVITVAPWEPYGELERTWFDPRSEYVSTYWLPILGPTTTWLAAKLADRFDRDPLGFELDCRDMSRRLGLGDGVGAAHGPLARALFRLSDFALASWYGDREPPDSYLARRHIPPLSRQQMARLPLSLTREGQP